MSTCYLIMFVTIVAFPSRSTATNAEKWSAAAFSYLSSMNCSGITIMTEKECHQLSRTKKSSVNIYLAEPTGEGRFLAVLPDGSLIRDGRHDGVLVLDPYPNANFGHLVIAFYLDLRMDSSKCEILKGISLDNECLLPVVKSRCHNSLGGNYKRVNFDRRCELDFLPLVYLQSENPHQSRQRLLCRNLPGFARCPQLRRKNDTEELICGYLKTNMKRACVSHLWDTAKCRLFETCDHAILLSGGWNTQIGLPRYFEDIVGFYEMLVENGFNESKIKIFYANGITQAKDNAALHVYPSTLKIALRSHLRRLCQTKRCVDSLVIYMNNPTQNDGTSLLWDINGNGQAEENEQYTMKELMDDVKNCTAQQVTIIADQSYSGLLVDALGDSHRHRNVQVFASSLGTEYAWSSEFTKHWVNFRHTHTCTRQVQEASETAVRSSNPSSYDGSQNTINRTIFGAPCGVLPPYDINELNSHYYGCQNIPISVWMTNNDSE